MKYPHTLRHSSIPGSTESIVTRVTRLSGEGSIRQSLCVAANRKAALSTRKLLRAHISSRTEVPSPEQLFRKRNFGELTEPHDKRAPYRILVEQIRVVVEPLAIAPRSSLRKYSAASTTQNEYRSGKVYRMRGKLGPTNLSNRFIAAPDHPNITGGR